MNAEKAPAAASPSRLPQNRIAPIAALLLLSPLVGEVLSGATRLSFIFAYLPEVMMWGCGTLIIRDVVRRWRGNWTTMLPLGLALSVAEEFIVQQTSLAPMPWLGSTPMYGRVWGVNWIYFLFMLAFESVCITLVPVQIVELIFSERRKEPWLRTRGMVISSVVFVAGAFLAWFLWVKIARIQVFHMPDYKPPMVTFVLGLIAIVVLVLISYALRGATRRESRRFLPSPFAMACIARHAAPGIPVVHPDGIGVCSASAPARAVDSRNRNYRLGRDDDPLASVLGRGSRLGRDA
jgi:hypothetical protein